MTTTDILAMYRDFVAHYGTPWDGVLNSGRYKYGTGENPYQRSMDFRAMVNKIKSENPGITNTQIAKAMGMSTTEFRAATSISKDELDKHYMVEVAKLKEKGMSNAAIAQQLGLSGESQVRNLLKRSETGRVDKTKEVADILAKQVDEKKYIDIGEGTEKQLGVSADKLKVAAAMLKDRGYSVQNIYVSQATNPNQKTTVKVLAKDGVTKKELYENRDQIMSINGYYTEDDGRTIRNVEPPVPVDRDRVMVRYNEQGGVMKDGVVELRPGVADISLGNAHYAQVRIALDGDRYIKGMAVYGDPKDFPKGVDIIVNSNKHVGAPDSKVFKDMKRSPDGKVDTDNPFGATIKNEEDLSLVQKHYTDKDGVEKQSVLNIVYEEGTWGSWKKSIASQMLSKQPVTTAKKQLEIAKERQRIELDDILALENPVVKRKLLDSFASGADEAAVELKGAAFPRQASQVILPINSLKPTEIYAPNYKNGEEVILIRYPHGGKFEIPRLTVNNNNKEGKAVITPNAKDAVGINYKTAAQLSGADFDGDTVLVIPTKGQNLKNSRPIESLVNFDTKESYPAYEGMPKVGPSTGFNKQKQMGMVSNLITDMTIKGATLPELVRATKHSMVIIDAEKHNLNWRQSEKDFNIEELRKKYQSKGPGKKAGGASTLISKAGGQKRVDERRAIYGISKMNTDPETGERIIKETGRTYQKAKKVIDPETGLATWVEVGKPKKYQSVVTPMSDTKDALTLSSGTAIEKVYGDYANSMKAMANEARQAYLTIKMPKRDAQARKEYAAEVESLTAKLNTAVLNKPKERQAQLVASKIIEANEKANPEMDNDQKKKMRNQIIKSARRRVGADSKGTKIEITSREWEAIQKNAISGSMLSDILDNADLDQVRKLATPRNNTTLTNAKIARIKSLARRGYSNAEIADDLGISASTVSNYINQ